MLEPTLKSEPTKPPSTFSKGWWEAKWVACNQSVPFGPVLLAVIIVTSAAVSAFFLPRLIRNDGEPHKWAELLRPEMRDNLTFGVTAAQPAEQKRLKEQVEHIANRANHHFEVMQFFYTNYYVSLLLGSIYGGLAALSLVLLTKAGWKEGGRCLASFFLTTTVCTTFFFTFPTWCKMDENATKNKALYVRYVGLLNDARTFGAIGDYAQDPQPTNTMSITNFILRMDSEMKKANDIAVAFDATKGPIYNLSTEKPMK